VTRLSWEQEAGYQLPVRVWREAMDAYFRGHAWVRLRKDAFDRLAAYKSRHALASWDETLDALLERSGDERSARGRTQEEVPGD
jgi:hypothetical protein